MLTTVDSAQWTVDRTKAVNASDLGRASETVHCTLLTVHCFSYQLDLTTPGISPLSANPRKHRRQTPNLRRKPRGRPQSWQRLCLRQLNFGFRASLTRFAVVAINPQILSAAQAPCRNGMPKARSSARAELSSLAVVTMVMFMPFSFSTLE
jgi:hypothetical protein